MTKFKKIIIIGAARSGTKFLRDVLSSGQGTAHVPYDINYVWRYGSENSRDDVLDPSLLTNKRKQFIQKTIASLAKSNSGDILIEKTVANTLRIPFVDAVFPDACYIHLVRDGRDVVESAMRQWNDSPHLIALFRKLRNIPLKNIDYVGWYGLNYLKGLRSGRKGGNVWGPRFPGIDLWAQEGPLSRVCAQQWLESYTRASKAFKEMPNLRSRVFTIRYEDLVKNDIAINHLMEQLSLPDKNTILQAFRSNVRPSTPHLWKNLPKRDVELISNMLNPVLSPLGYYGCGG
jgi:hypothetical protein